MPAKIEEIDPRQVDSYMTELYSEFYEFLIAYADNAMDNPKEAEELIQETFLVACQKRKEFSESENPKGWLVNTLKNKIQEARRERDTIRRLMAKLMKLPKRRVVSYIEETPTIMNLFYKDILVRPNRLTESEYDMLMKIGLYDYTMKELSEEYNTTVECCKKRVQRAREKAQRILKREK